MSMTASQRIHEIEMIQRQITAFGHTVKRDGLLCLTVNNSHAHQASLEDMHAYLSGYLQACETYEWRDATRTGETDDGT